MKALKIIVALEEGKVLTTIKTNGFSKESISDQLEILGILENLKQLQTEKIKKLAEFSK